MKTVKAVYFSATGTTEKVVCRIAEKLANELHLSVRHVDFTLPQARLEPLCFEAEDLVVFGTPVYAGRVPNVLLKYLQTLQGNGAQAVAICVYGNRNFDDALIELRDILDDRGAHTIAAGAFIGEHSFSTILGANRPDAEDLRKADEFAFQIAQKAAKMAAVVAAADLKSAARINIPGHAKETRQYFQPQDRNGNPIDIRKVLPKVDPAKCLQSISTQPCNICAHVCPMGSINRVNVQEYTGICIKCGACIKKCPAGARYYDDPGYLYHKTELEEMYASHRAEPIWFL